MFIAILLVLVGLGILVAGAEALVRGSASMAKKMGISSLVIGLTVVAFGTSMPELVVNMVSAFKGTADIAIGNVVGSNIANILLILGIAAMIYPLKVAGSTVWKEIPFAILALILVYIMGNDALVDGMSFNILSRTDGLLLISVFIIFMFYIVSLAKKGEIKEEKVSLYSWPLSIVLTLVGLAFLGLGGKILVDNAVILATLAGLSQAFIGLTIVAVGTSLPELATSIVAAIHKHDDIAVGNIIGSNIFNVFWILGLTATLMPLPFNPAASFDVLVGVATTLLLFVFMFISTKHKIDRWQGVTFLALYVGYILYLVNRG